MIFDSTSTENSSTINISISKTVDVATVEKESNCVPSKDSTEGDALCEVELDVTSEERLLARKKNSSNEFSRLKKDKGHKVGFQPEFQQNPLGLDVR